jgi:hypothetical protein
MLDFLADLQPELCMWVLNLVCAHYGMWNKVSEIGSVVFTQYQYFNIKVSFILHEDTKKIYTAFK